MGGCWRRGGRRPEVAGLQHQFPLMWGAVIGDPRQGTCAATVSDRAIDCQEDTAVSLEEHKRRERAQAIGLFRYQLICPALEAGL